MKSGKATRLALGALAALALSAGAANAQLEIKIMAPAAPGGGWDQTARAMQTAMTKSGAAKSVQVVNVPGAGGTIGLAQLVNTSKGDGNLLMMSGLVMMGAILTNKSPVTLDKATPIARLTAEYVAIVVPANSPLKDAQALAAALKADPAKVTWAGGSAGSVDHIAAGLFAKAIGVDPAKINYIAHSGGGEALAAMIGGRVTAGVSGYAEVEAQIKTKRLRLIGITSPARLPGVDGPTLKEQGIDVVISNWRSVMAAPGLSDAQKKALIAAVEKMAKSPAWAEVLKQKNWDDAYMPGDEFAAFLKAEQTRVTEVMRSIGLAK
jgi:putative tricarboxylic transport membrane protein